MIEKYKDRFQPQQKDLFYKIIHFKFWLRDDALKLGKRNTGMGRNEQSATHSDAKRFTQPT